MSFIQIAPLSLGIGRDKLTNAVRCRSDGGAFQFVLSGDVAQKIGLSGGSRAHCSLGVGSHAGVLAISVATNGAAGTYKVQSAGKHGNAQISIGSAHFGQRGQRFRTINCKFEVIDGSLMVRLPTQPEILQRPSAPRGEHRAAA